MSTGIRFFFTFFMVFLVISAEIRAKESNSKKEKTKPTLMVLNFTPKGEIDAGLLGMLNDLTMMEVSGLDYFKVIGQDEIKNMLAMEHQRLAAGCSDTGCIAEIGGAMGARFALSGSISAYGQKSMLSLQLIDVGKADVLTRKGQLISGNRGKLVEIVNELVRQLFVKVVPKEYLKDLDNHPGGSQTFQKELNVKKKKVSLINIPMKKSKLKSSELTVDQDTGLMWQIGHSPKKMIWKKAKKYCNDLSLDGYTDWRLPTKGEYMDLLGRCPSTLDRYGSGIKGYCNRCSDSLKCQKMFSGDMNWYWTSTEYASNSFYAWNIYFNNGFITRNSKESLIRVRCLRSSSQ